MDFQAEAAGKGFSLTETRPGLLAINEIELLSKVGVE